MAVTATFAADFSDFYSAVQKAEASLKSFESGAGKVEKSLNRMVDQFSGRKVLQEAALMERAVAEVGGVSRLTQNELQALGAKAQEAVAKMRALGVEIPPGLQKIANEAKNANTATKTFLGSLGNVNQILGAFGVSLSLGALVGFGRELLRTGDELVRVADRTGLTTTEVQRLQYIAQQSGNSVDQFTSAISRLQRGLVSGDKNVVAAIGQLGLNLTQLKAATPFEQMEQIAGAIGKIENPANRAAIAIQLFGRSGAEILPTLIADFKRLGDEAPVMADKTVRALDQAGDSLHLFGQTAKVWAAELYNLAGRGFDRLIAAAYDANAAMLRMVASVVETVKKIPGAGKALEGLGVSTEALRKEAQYFTDVANAQRAALNRVDEEVRKSVPPMEDYGEAARRVGEAVTRSTAAHLDGVDAIDAMRKANQAAYQAEVAMGRQALKTSESLRGLAATNGILADSFQLAKEKMDAFTVAQPTTQKFGLDEFFTMGTIPTPSPEDFKQTFATALAGAAKGIPDLLIRAFTGGGGLKGAARAIGTKFGEELFGDNGAFATVTKKLSGGLTSLFGKTIGGALAAAIPGIGALIAPAIEGLGKLFGKLFGGPSKEQRAARDEQAKLIEGFRELGFVGSDFDVLAKGIGDTFRDIGKDGEEARRVLEMALDTDHPERYAQALREINAALAEQKKRWEGTQEAVSALNTFTEEGIDTQGKFDLAAGSAIAIFDAWVKKTGDVVGALEQIGPALDDLIKSQKDFGFAGNAAIDQLLGLRKVAEANEPLMDNISQSTMLLKALGKAGILTQDLVIGFGQNAVNQFTLLKGATGDAKQALALMQPELQELWEHQQKFGDITDESTLALLDQAETNGIVGEDMKDINQQVLDVLKLIAKALGAEIPDAAERAAKGITDNLDGLNPTIDIDFDVHEPDLPDFEQFHTGGVVDRFHTGGLIDRAGKVLPFIPRAHSGLAVDEVPIIAQTGEGILNRSAMRRIGGAATLNYLNAGGSWNAGPAGSQRMADEPSQPVIIELRLNDGTLFDRFILDASRDKRGLGTKLKKLVARAS